MLNANAKSIDRSVALSRDRVAFFTLNLWVEFHIKDVIIFTVFIP